MLVRSISGLRATPGDDLTADLIVRYATAFASLCEEGPIVVGRDGRRGGEAIENLLLGSLAICGFDAWRLGVAPTPTVGLATEKSEAAGGIAITASHNPAEWNGLKFFGSDGVFLGPKECAELFERVDRGEPWSVRHDRQGRIVDRSDLLRRHVEATLRLPFLDTEAIAERRFRVVVDAVNASGSEIVPRLLEELDCEVIRLYCDRSGVFPHTPEPLPENLGDLAAEVVARKADLGIAVDPDADRLVLIDEKGKAIGEEYSITLAADYLLPRAAELGGEPVVTVNLSTTRAVDDVAERHGGRVTRTAVGEINVVEGMREAGSVVGGEGSGGVIVPALHYGRDALVGIAVTLASLAESDRSLAELRASLPDYTIVKRKLELGRREDALPQLDRLEEGIGREGRVDRTDGIRIDFERSWVHVRPSNTEPILRIIAEAPTAGEATELIDRVGREVSQSSPTG